ncbi:hypothetical protein [Mucilaginibacter sp. CSA2-8R]|uniref:hypothetical protein n=1 Tax=Mucilaginibacter sp. CSA2-8R TaxID=3141542 RepID=UPI00315D1202
MKKNLLFLPLFLCSCSHFQSNQQKAESLVKSYLDSTLNDPKSYESMKFDTLRTQYAQYGVGDPEGRRLDSVTVTFLDSASKYKEKADKELVTGESLTNYNKYSELKKLYDAKADSVSKLSDEKGKGYKGPVFAYSIVHSFRAKNGMGALTIQKMRFRTDSALNKITSAGEVD